MQIRSISATLATLAGCAGPLGSHTHDHENMLGELRRSERTHASATDDATLFAGEAALDRDALVAAVLDRNPDAEASRQGWRAALAEAAAAGALDDPMLTYEVAPLSVAGDAPFGQRITVSQKLPYPGKRRLAAQIAVAEAEAARGDHEAVRLELALMAAELYADFYFADRSLEVNDHHRALIERMKKSAEAQLSVGRGAEQDSLAAEVELGHLEHERVMLATERAGVIARLNGLLHRDPRAAVPPPPVELPLPAEPPAIDELEQAAIAQRPQQQSARAMLRARHAATALAKRAFYPDLEVMGSYDSMWDMPEHRWMLGVSIEVPVQRGRRRAEVEASDARAAQAEAALEGASDEIRVDVARAHRDLMDGFHVAKLYDQRLLPAARDEVDAALVGYTASQNDFSAVIAAEKDLRAVELEAHRARADLWRRSAALDRAVGRVPGDAP